VHIKDLVAPACSINGKHDDICFELKPEHVITFQESNTMMQSK
jgi:hypothetical protein